MDFAFSEEQQMLRDQARSFMSSKFGSERVAELATSDDGWDPSTWKEMAGLGWTGLSVPEEHGGAGMGFIEDAVLFEELGYALYPGPFFATVALAVPALRNAPDLLAEVTAGETVATLAWAEPSGSLTLDDLDKLQTKAEGSDGNWTLSGDKFLVPDAHAADLIVVVARSGEGLGLFAVRAADLTVNVSPTMDATRRLGSFSLDGVAAQQVAGPGDVEGILRSVRLRALSAVSLEATGVAQKALELAQNYTQERQQFDKPIGTYQAVSHQVADTYMNTELARSLAYWAAWCVAEDHEQVELAVAAAKSMTAEAAVFATERSIQVHGGIGFTWEHILHRYYKRAQWIDSFSGFAAQHRKPIAATLLD